MVRPITNAAFDALLRAAGYGNAHAAFARQLNYAGRTHGTWRYDAASVYWWLRGRRPAEHVQATMAKTFARRLGRPVAGTELGFTTTEVAADASYPTSAVHAIDAAERLWAVLAEQVNTEPGGTFQTGYALQAALAWRYDLPDGMITCNGRQQVTSGDIESLYALAGHFTDLDRRHGGGFPRTRALMIDLLVRQVAPMLHGTYTDTIGRDLMRATATLSGQLAFMSYDAGDHGTAQRHLTIALRLAKAADDRLYGAHLLANLATQAVYLGHAQDAARLAEAAIDGAGRAPAAVRARLYTTAASAYGRSGEQRACQTALLKAERAIDRADPASSPRWATYFSPAHFAGTALKCLSDLSLFRKALRHAPAAVTLANQNARTRALHTALIATTHARSGDIEAACDWGRELAQCVPAVHSARVTHRVRELTATLGPHQAMPQVKELLLALSAPTVHK
ncbi:hypothetical protein OOK41_21345 [Micromonospora sp. NBC_01655]|uniref:hypothetical protein n=1 Tax=Micromonospora sp. NBC_01655 TaxID=2975983 RepID=UPI0022527237|nr:hypothetical protein [Micromonospora sp. NBC_01655]MCX4472825.1 hypothetical protein [Micromonospora sp. NBC_01655]